MHAGLYKGDRLNYADPLGLAFDGTYVLTAKGTPERPIVIRAAGDGEVIFDGDGAPRLFDVMAADYHIFEGLTIRNTDVAFQAGLKDVAGREGADRPQLPARERRHRRQRAVCRLAGFLHRRQRHSSGATTATACWAGSDPGIYGANRLKSYYAVKVYGRAT